jgi:radical SAM superfamily enzyme YgiQ (UPF0313 family)
MRVLFPFSHLEEENLGVMYLAAMLERGGHRTEVIAADLPTLARRLSDGVPSILAYSTLAFYARHLLQLNRQVRRSFPRAFSVFGGHHATAAPQIIEHEGVDAVCIGEGEHPLRELADGLEAGRDVTAIPNLWVRAGGEVRRNDLRPLDGDLDRLPFPRRRLLRVRAPFFQERISVVTSRGCRFSCPYCYNSTLRRLYGGRSTYRRRSVDNVIEEIQQARAQQPVRFILFQDDIFTLDPAWVEAFCEAYGARVGIPFSCNIRIDQVSPGLADRLLAAGCHSVSFGLESGDERVRTHLLQRPISSRVMVSRARMLRRRGLRVRTTNIVAAEPGSEEADLASIRLNVRCGVDFAKVGALARYPNTDLGREAPAGGRRWGELAEVPLPLPIRLLGRLSENLVGRYQRKQNMFFLAGGAGRDAAGARRADNLQKLFPLVVELPWLLPLLRPLLRLPLGRPLVHANFFWDIYCSYFRIYDAGWMSLVRGLRAYRAARREAA